jgi:phosphatidate cytidylyltransferase
MIQRTVYGAAALMVLLALFLLDAQIAREATVPLDPRVDAAATWRNGPVGALLRHGSIIPLTVLLVALAGARELDQLMRSKGAEPCTRFALLMIGVAIVVPWLSPTGMLGSDVIALEGLVWSMTCVIVSVIGTGVLVVLRRDPSGAIANIGATLTMILYMGFLLSFAVHLRSSRDVPGLEGAWLLLITVVVTKASDIGAYFAGSALGRHKLLPRVSPGKSVEGVFGGLAGSALAAMVFVLLFRVASAPSGAGPGAGAEVAVDGLLLLMDMTRTFGAAGEEGSLPALARAAIFGLIMSGCGQMGDLVESSFKRDAEAKDSGKVLPRFGGILDLVDSPAMSVPVAWLLLTVVWRVV